jgi:hypothetical protein
LISANVALYLKTKLQTNPTQLIIHLNSVTDI